MFKLFSNSFDGLKLDAKPRTNLVMWRTKDRI